MYTSTCMSVVEVTRLPEPAPRARPPCRRRGGVAVRREYRLYPLFEPPKMRGCPSHHAVTFSSLSWLTTHSGWLLIVDNADDPAALRSSGALSKALPPNNAPGHVLLTSRVGTQDFGAIGASALQLQLLSEAVVADGVTAAEVLLLRHAREALGHDVHTDVDVAKMVTQLEPSERAAVAWLAGDEGVAGLPLAIQQAGDAIRENEDETFAGYCELYRARRIAFFADGPEGNNREAQSARQRCWPARRLRGGMLSTAGVTAVVVGKVVSAQGEEGRTC